MVWRKSFIIDDINIGFYSFWKFEKKKSEIGYRFRSLIILMAESLKKKEASPLRVYVSRRYYPRTEYCHDDNIGK